MAVTYSAALKTTRMTAVVTAIDAGSGAGKLKIYTSGDSLLATVTLADPSGTVSGAVLTFSGLPKTAVASGTGTAAKATITDSDDTAIVSGLTVGTAATDIVIDSTSIISGQTISFNSTSTITHG